MTQVTLVAAISIFSYLLGSFPSGYLAGRIAGIDIRKAGSGNIGATNVLRVLGKKHGYTVFFFDAIKGLIAVEVAFAAAKFAHTSRHGADSLGILAAVLCVFGHTFPVWLKFQGGKGVATSAGVMFGLAPLPTLVSVAVWFVVFELTRYVSVASVTAAFALPITIGILLKLHVTQGVVIFYSASLLAVIVCWRHRSNFARLVKGTEQRFIRK